MVLLHVAVAVVLVMQGEWSTVVWLALGWQLEWLLLLLLVLLVVCFRQT